MVRRKFFKDEENPYDTITQNSGEFRDAQKLSEPVSSDVINNFDTAGRRIIIGETGTPQDDTSVISPVITRATTGAKVLIEPDSTRGISVIDDAGNEIFTILIGGSDVGDVILGNYGAGQGIWYDKSAGVIYYKNLAWSEVVDDDGNAPDDNATVGAVAGTNLKDSGAVVLTDEQVKNILTLTAGVNIAQYNAVRINSDGKLNKASSLYQSWVDGFIGIATEAITKDSTGKIQLIGYPTMTGLTAGSAYYLQDGTLDQQNTSEDTNYDVEANAIWVAQTFTTGASITALDWVEIKCRGNAAGAFTLKASIYTIGGGGAPDTLLGDSDITSANNGATPAFTKAYFAKSVPLSANTQYAIVIKHDETVDLLIRYNNASSYASGSQWRKVAGTWTDVGGDIAFKTSYADGSIETTPGAITKQAGKALSSTKLFLATE